MHPADAMFYLAKIYPQRLAVILPYMAVTYRAMAEAIEAASQRIKRCELSRSEPVAVAIDDPAKLIAVCLALVRSGISCAPTGHNAFAHLQSNNINTLIHSAPSAILAGGRNIKFDNSWLRPETSSSAGEKTSQFDSSLYGDLIFFTSGTTGVPKKVIMSSRAFTERVNILPVTGEAAHSRVLILPGLASVFGFNRAATVLYAGKTLCFAYGPEVQLRFINTFNIDVIVASVQQIIDILNVLKDGAKYRSDSLKEVWVSGGFASADLVRRIQTSLCRNVVIVYGSSESGFAASARYDMISHVPHAVGFVVPVMRIEIVDGSGNPVAPGQEGLVRGQSKFISEVFAANHPEKTVEASDAWWYPGDLGSLTEDGILCISGRTDDVINMGGVKIAASVLDEKARAYPGIKDAGTCGVQSQAGAEELWIGVVTDTNIDMADFRRSLEENQGDRLSVAEIFVIDKIPRNDLGKMQRHELKATLLGIKNRALLRA